MTELDLDLQPNGDSFDAVFRLPETFPEDLRAVHTEMITRMRNESRAVSAGTNVLILIERMAWFYVQMKYSELYGEPLSLKELKEVNDFWLKMHSEYNKLITSAESRSRIAMLEAIQDVVSGIIGKIDDPAKKYEAQSQLRAEFEKLGV
jgi:hypothetical protein